jgi:hypothetical protein
MPPFSSDTQFVSSDFPEKMPQRLCPVKPNTTPATRPCRRSSADCARRQA